MNIRIDRVLANVRVSPYRKFSAVCIKIKGQSFAAMVQRQWHEYMVSTHLRDSLAIQTHHNAAQGLISKLDVKVDLMQLVSIARSSLLQGQLPC